MGLYPKPDSPTPGKPTVYKVRDATGRLIAKHVRIDKPDGKKKVWWERPDGTSGLNGTRLGDLPLYNSQLVKGWDPDNMIVFAEGEKACEALHYAGLNTLGRVCGAGATPGPEVLEVLRDRRVCLWPDNDAAGRDHMDRIGRDLEGVASEVLVHAWDGAPEKGDAADHPAVRSQSRKAIDRLLTDLESAPRWKPTENPNSKNGKGKSPSKKSKAKQEEPTDDELRSRFLHDDPDLAYGLGEWRRYKDGIWPAVDELLVKREVCRTLEAAKSERVRPTAARMNSVTEMTRVEVAVPNGLWDAGPDILVCQNSALNLQTLDLVTHAKEHYATEAVPYAYDPEARSEVWEERVMGELVAENWDVDTVRFLQEFAGYALTTDCSHEIALWLTGPKGGGRSTILAGLDAMLGPKAGVLSLSDIERSSFALTNLPGKTLVTATEQPSVFLRGGGVVNNIISGEPVQVDRKYQQPIKLTLRCKIAWAMNELPRVGNMDDGIFRRVKVLELPEIPEDKKDPAVKEAVKESRGWHPQSGTGRVATSAGAREV